MVLLPNRGHIVLHPLELLDAPGRAGDTIQHLEIQDTSRTLFQKSTDRKQAENVKESIVYTGIVLIVSMLVALSACGGAPPASSYLFPHDDIEYVFWERCEDCKGRIVAGLYTNKGKQLVAEAERLLISLYLSGSSEPMCPGLDLDKINGLIFKSEVERDLLCGESNCESEKVSIAPYSNSDGSYNSTYESPGWWTVNFLAYAAEDNLAWLTCSVGVGSPNHMLVSRNAEGKIVFAIDY